MQISDAMRNSIGPPMEADGAGANHPTGAHAGGRRRDQLDSRWDADGAGIVRRDESQTAQRRPRCRENAVGFLALPVVELVLGRRGGGVIAAAQKRQLRLFLVPGEPGVSPLAGAQLLGQLVAARVAVELVLGGVDGLRFFEDLARELLVVDGRVATRVRRQLRGLCARPCG